VDKGARMLIKSSLIEKGVPQSCKKPTCQNLLILGLIEKVGALYSPCRVTGLGVGIL
jgi:hypothetical protein